MLLYPKNVIIYLKLRGKVFSGRWLKKFRAKSLGQKSFGAVGFGRMGGTTFLSSLVQKLIVQSRIFEQTNSMVNMIKGAAVDSAKGAGCHCRVPLCRTPYVQQWVYYLSHFQIFMNSAAVTRLFHGVVRHGCSDGSCRSCRVPLQSTKVQGAVCATIYPAKSAECFC